MEDKKPVESQGGTLPITFINFVAGCNTFYSI